MHTPSVEAAAGVFWTTKDTAAEYITLIKGYSGFFADHLITLLQFSPFYFQHYPLTVLCASYSSSAVVVLWCFNEGGIVLVVGSLCPYHIILNLDFRLWQFYKSLLVARNMQSAAVTRQLMRHPPCPCVQAMTSRVTGSSRATVESGRAWPACCPAGTQTTSFPSRITVRRPPSCNLQGPLREVERSDKQ